MHAIYEQTDEGSRTVVTPGANFRGFDGVLQGGIIAGLMDDAMWYAVLGQGDVTMTVELTVRYKKPVPVDTRLTVRGFVKEKRRSVYLCTAQVLNDRGEALAEAQGKFMAAPKQFVQAVTLINEERRET